MEVRERIGRYKYTPESEIASEFRKINEELVTEIAGLVGREDR